MKTNVGPLDRVIRLVIALGLAALILTGVLKGLWAILLGVLAVLLLITSAIGFCSLYTFFRSPKSRRPGGA